MGKLIVEEIISLIEEGKTYAEIGKLDNVKSKAIGMRLSKAGIKHSDIIPKVIHNDKACVECGSKIPYNRKFCSRSCSVSYHNRGRNRHGTGDSNRCKVCKKILNSTQRSHCSRGCEKFTFENIRLEKISSWLNGEWDGSYDNGRLNCTIRKYVRDESGHKCSKCGWGEPNPKNGVVHIEVNHIDGDNSNNSPENLEVLCPNCHSLTPNYKSLNKGVGRDKMIKMRS